MKRNGCKAETKIIGSGKERKNRHYDSLLLAESVKTCGRREEKGKAHTDQLALKEKHTRKCNDEKVLNSYTLKSF